MDRRLRKSQGFADATVTPAAGVEQLSYLPLQVLREPWPALSTCLTFLLYSALERLHSCFFHSGVVATESASRTTGLGEWIPPNKPSSASKKAPPSSSVPPRRSSCRRASPRSSPAAS